MQAMQREESEEKPKSPPTADKAGNLTQLQEGNK
jgi:hypothetical protein